MCGCKRIIWVYTHTAAVVIHTAVRLLRMALLAGSFRVESCLLISHLWHALSLALKQCSCCCSAARSVDDCMASCFPVTVTPCSMNVVPAMFRRHLFPVIWRGHRLSHYTIILLWTQCCVATKEFLLLLYVTITYRWVEAAWRKILIYYIIVEMTELLVLKD